MEFKNWTIQSKNIENTFYIKLIDKNTFNSYENIIEQKDLKDITIDKFIKFFVNCVNLQKDYELFINCDDDDSNTLVLLLKYSTDLLDLEQHIFLNKIDETTNDDIYGKLSNLEKKINNLSMVSIGKIYNLETYDFNFSNITYEYIKYPTDTEAIEIIIPEEIYDITTNKRNSFDIELNQYIDCCETFTNLKKLKTNIFPIIYYFCSNVFYWIGNPGETRGNPDNETEKKLMLFTNNTIEEIVILNNVYGPTNPYDEIEKYLTNKYKTKYPYFLNNYQLNKSLPKLWGCKHRNKDFDERFNSSRSKYSGLKLHLPKLKKIIYDTTIYTNTIDIVLLLLKSSKIIETVQIKTIDCKFCCNADCLPYYQKNIQDIRTHCQNNNIKLEIGEIIY